MARAEHKAAARAQHAKVFEHLLADFLGSAAAEHLDQVADETADDWQELVSAVPDQAAEKLFEQVASEVSCWLETLAANKNSTEIKAKTGYNNNNIYSQRQ